jgi:adenylate cyclase
VDGLSGSTAQPPARRRRNGDERLRPTRRAATPAGDGASAPRPRRQTPRPGERGADGRGGRAAAAPERGAEAGERGDERVTLEEAAARAGVRPATLRRWCREGLIPPYEGRWTRAAVGHARMVARLRERGHSLAEIRKAIADGRLAFGFIEELLPDTEGRHSLRQAVQETGLDAALIERIVAALGWSPVAERRLSEVELGLLRTVAAVLESGFPLVALLQLARVYGQSMAQVADAEVRLFHLYVHEPLMRSGADGVEVAEEVQGMTRELLPLAAPLMERIHEHYLQHFVEQDVVGHMESDLDGRPEELGRLRVAIAFADLAGYTRMTEEEGEEQAVDAVERFVESVELTLPDDARVIKTIGDAVMVVGTDASALVDWAVAFQSRQRERPLPRIGMHAGEALYRDGDYFGRDVNIAARVSARSAGGEVLVTRPVVQAAGPHLRFERIGEIKLKGFSRPTEIFLARRRGPGPR